MAEKKKTAKEELAELKDESEVDFAEKIKTVQIAPQGIRKGKEIMLRVNGVDTVREQVEQRK